VTAGVIDVAIGALPGVGVPASVVNGILGLTGNQTIGGWIADQMFNGKAPTGPVAHSTGDGGLAIDLNAPIAIDTGTSTPDDHFVSTYIDRTPRPTPGQRWRVSGRDTYGGRTYG